MISIPSIDEAEKLIEEKLGGWFDVVISHIPNFIVAIVIAIVFSILARFAGKLMKNVLRRSLDSTQIADLMASIFKVIVLCIGLFIALDFVGLKGTVTSLLAGAGIVGLAIGFAFQDMTENLIAGIAMAVVSYFIGGALDRLASPLSVVTLGLFKLVVDAVIVYVTHMLLKGFRVQNFMAALILAIAITIVQIIF